MKISLNLLHKNYYIKQLFWFSYRLTWETTSPTGIWPFRRDIFTDEDFEPTCLADFEPKSNTASGFSTLKENPVPLINDYADIGMANNLPIKENLEFNNNTSVLEPSYISLEDTRSIHTVWVESSSKSQSDKEQQQEGWNICHHNIISLQTTAFRKMAYQ